MTTMLDEKKKNIGAMVPVSIYQRLDGTARRDHSDKSKTMITILDRNLPPLEEVKKFCKQA